MTTEALREYVNNDHDIEKVLGTMVDMANDGLIKVRYAD